MKSAQRSLQLIHQVLDYGDKCTAISTNDPVMPDNNEKCTAISTNDPVMPDNNDKCKRSLQTMQWCQIIMTSAQWSLQMIQSYVGLCNQILAGATIINEQSASNDADCVKVLNVIENT